MNYLKLMYRRFLVFPSECLYTIASTFTINPKKCNCVFPKYRNKIFVLLRAVLAGQIVNFRRRKKNKPKYRKHSVFLMYICKILSSFY